MDKDRVETMCRCGHEYMPEHDTNSYGCSVEGCKCQEFTPRGTPAWNADDYQDEVPGDVRTAS